MKKITKALGGKEVCLTCGKTVYPMEKMSHDNNVFHKDCFKCVECKRKLTTTDCNVFQGKLLCKLHYGQAAGGSGLSRQASSGSISAPPPSPSPKETDELSVKTAQLKAMFETLDEMVIRAVLKESNLDVDRAVDSLLNLSALSTSSPPPSQSSPIHYSNVATHSPPLVASSPHRDPIPSEHHPERDRSNTKGKNVIKNVITGMRGGTLKKPDEKQNGEPQTKFSDFSSIDEQVMQATKENNIAMIKHFMSEMKPFLTRDISGLLNSCLLICIERGNVDIMRLFLNNDANPNGTDDAAMSPLMLAIESNQLQCAKLLLQDYHADPNKSKSPLSPLHLAVKYGYGDLVKMLLDKGAHVNRLDPETGKTALHMAVEIQDYDIAAKLLEFKADLNFKENSHGDTPLHISMKTCKSTREMMLTCLLLERAKENGIINIRNSRGETALHIAVSRSKGQGTYLVDLVLRFSPDFSIQNIDGKTALDLAHTVGNPQVLQKLQDIAKSPRSPRLHDKEEEESSLVRNKPKPLSMSDSLPVPPQKPPKPPKPSPLAFSTPNANTLSNGPSSPRGVPPPLSQLGKSSSNPSLLSKTPPTPPPKPSTPPTSNNNAVSGGQLSSEMDPDYKLVQDFKKAVQQKIDAKELENEFNFIEEETGNANLIGDFTSALQPANIRKNRYKNILPYESTRVKLQQLPEQENSDFFSANWISGETPGSEKMYIATQGPLMHTSGDFWRMVWETNAVVVVMLASEIENGKEKCYQYWPEEIPLEFELHTVSRNSFSQTNQIISRYFTLTDKQSGKSRLISQFQYTGWPDQGLPDNTEGFNKIIDLADSENKENCPIVVHCSAGIGRTGVFCVVHTILCKLRLLLSISLPTSFDIKDVVLRMRDQRAGMVQTPEQYIFCYMSLNEKLTETLKLISYKNERWFHKSLDSNQANQLLQHKPHGTFLFRASSIPGFLVLSAVSGKTVLHARISVSEKGFGLEQDTYPSLTALVESRRQILIHPLLRK